MHLFIVRPLQKALIKRLQMYMEVMESLLTGLCRMEKDITINAVMFTSLIPQKERNFVWRIFKAVGITASQKPD